MRVATIGCAQGPDSEDHELSLEERIAWVLLNRKAFWDACENGVDLRSVEKIVKRFERKPAAKKEKRWTKMKSKLLF